MATAPKRQPVRAWLPSSAPTPAPGPLYSDCDKQEQRVKGTEATERTRTRQRAGREWGGQRAEEWGVGGREVGRLPDQGLGDRDEHESLSPLLRPARGAAAWETLRPQGPLLRSSKERSEWIAAPGGLPGSRSCSEGTSRASLPARPRSLTFVGTLRSSPAWRGSGLGLRGPRRRGSGGSLERGRLSVPCGHRCAESVPRRGGLRASDRSLKPLLRP